MQAIQRWILAALRDRIFFCVNELNDAIVTLLDRYNNKVIKRLDKSRTQLFEENDKPYLQTLPANRFVCKEFKLAIVNIDYHVELLKCFYSVPFKYLKEKVEIRYSTTHPRLYKPNATSTLKEHMLLNHQYQHEKMNPQRLKNWAASVGTNAKMFVEKKLENAEYPTNAYRGIIAILSLEKIYGKANLNLALGYASSIRSILDKKLYLQAVNNHTVKPTTPTHKNICGSKYYK